MFYDKSFLKSQSNDSRIRDKNILKEVLAFASSKKINSRVFEDDKHEVFSEKDILSAKQMEKRLADAIIQGGISMDDFKKQMESWR
ncbi:MAG: hypothetical protein ACK4YV_02180 [Emticicia sp.]